MAKMLRCRDLGLECSYVARAETESELMASAAEHARNVHQLDTGSPDVREKIRGAIRHDEELERHEPPRTPTGPVTAPKFGSAGSGGAEYERLPEQYEGD